MTATGALAGIRIAVADTVDDTATNALRTAGAVIVTTGESDIVMTTQAPAGAVCLTPSAAAFPTQLSVAAPDLILANLAMTALAAGAATRAWPSDVRLAAPAEPVVGIVTDPDSPAAFDKVTAALSGAGARVVAVALDAPVPLNIPGELDAVITLASPTVVDLCAVTVDVDGLAVTVLARPFEDAVALDVAASVSDGHAIDHVWPLSAADPVELVVFGAHLRGGPLTFQLTDLGARWAGEVTTAPRYRMTVLPTVPAKPAITRVPDGAAGGALYGERWLMSAAALGRFLAALPDPMQLGKVEFDDGTWRTAFSCDAAAATGTDISGYGSWPHAVAAGAVQGLG